MRRLIGLVMVTLTPACTGVLGYDDITFDEGDGAVGTGAVAAGGSSTGGGAGVAGSGGTGGSGGAATGGASGSGGSATGGTSGSGGSAAGGTSGSGGSATGGTSGSGGSGGSATGGASGSGGSATGGTSGSGGAATGGSGGSGGSATGGSGGSATGGTSGSGGSPTGHYETKTNPGATGSEPGGLIPVCCVPSASEKTAIMQNFDLVNQHRIANGRSALAYDDKLEAAIEAHSHHMATHTFFEHTAPEASVSSPWTRANLCGTSANAENIYYGSANATNAFNAWKNSSGHNANMLNANLKRIGIGLYGTRWGQLFGN